VFGVLFLEGPLRLPGEEVRSFGESDLSAVVACFRRLRAAATVSFASGAGEPGNERGGLSETDAGEPVLGSG
jgi:hypothetical protein